MPRIYFGKGSFYNPEKAGEPDFQLRDLRGKYASDHTQGRDMPLHTSKKVFDDHYMRVAAEVTPLGVTTRKPNTRNRWSKIWSKTKGILDH